MVRHISRSWISRWQRLHNSRWEAGQPPRGSCGVSGQLRTSGYPSRSPLTSVTNQAIEQSLIRPFSSGRGYPVFDGGLTRPLVNDRTYQALDHQGLGTQSLVNTRTPHGHHRDNRSTLHGQELQALWPTEQLCRRLLLDSPSFRAPASLALSRPPALRENVAWPLGWQLGTTSHLVVITQTVSLTQGQRSLHSSHHSCLESKKLTTTTRPKDPSISSSLGGLRGFRTFLGGSCSSREAHVQAGAYSGGAEGPSPSVAEGVEAAGGAVAGAGAGGQPSAERNPSFSTVLPEDLAVFRQIVGESGVVVDPDALQPHNQDWMGKYRGSSKVMLRPKSTEEVSAILAHCNARQLAVVPQGGNTGLVGGSVPVFDEIILSLGAMNRVRSWDPTSGAVVADAGVVLEALDSFVAGHGHMVPLDLGAKGSCQIGGNVSTNAGGLRVLRYGSLHGSVLGLEVVLPSGEVLDLLSPLRKDNAGYDLKHLFIGSEGTLGVVTGVAILAPPRPQQVDVAFVAAPTYEAVLELFKGARQRLGELLSAFEFLDAAALAVALEHLEGVRDPLPSTRAPFYALVETSSSGQGAGCQERLTEFLQWAAEEGHVSDGVLAQDGQQLAAIWRVREGVAEALQRAGAVYKYDFSIPLPVMYDFVKETRERLDGLATTVSYGHLGDGNLHLNISAPKYDSEILHRLEPFVYEWVAAHRGSISAEHGLGRMKAKAIHYSRTPLAVKTMRQLKQLFDPSGILNPYKVLPDV